MSGPTILDHYKYAVLATAAYVRTGGSTDSAAFVEFASTAQANRLPRVLGEKLFIRTAENSEAWNILQYYGNDVPGVQDNTGFAATLFERAGEKVLAIRGSEPFSDQGVDLGSAGIGQIGVLGLALTQVVSMVNLIQRMRAEPGSPAVQIRVNASLVPPGGDYLTVAGIPPMFLSFSTYMAEGVGGIAPGETIKVTGHSLGGHLAYMAARLFPGVVDPQVHVYNAAGYDPTTASFVGLGGAIGVALTAAAKIYLTAEFGIAAAGVLPGANQLTEPALDLIVTALRGPDAVQGMPTVFNLHSENIVPGDDLSIVASRVTGADRYPAPIDVPSEANSHVIEPLMDALALHALLESLNDNLSLSDMGLLLMASSSELVRSEERLTEALRTLFLGERGELPLSDAVGLDKISKGSIDARAGFHDAVLRIQEEIQDRGYSLDRLFDITPADLVNLAQGSEAIAYRYALKELNPFAIVGDNALYAAHNVNGALNLVDFTSGVGNLTPMWLRDRAEMLGWKNDYYEQDGNVALRGNRIESYQFIDKSIKDDHTGQDLTLTVVGRNTLQVNNPAMMIFGSDADESLVGGNVAVGDHLYGGGGDDILQGNSGYDYLEGGLGNDTYVWNTGDGFDTILDADGIGRLVVNGKVVLGGVKVAQGEYIDGDDLVLRFEGDPVLGGVLLVNGDLRVENFVSGQLGIVLNDHGSLADVKPTVHEILETSFPNNVGFGTGEADLVVTANLNSIFVAKGGDDLLQVSDGTLGPRLAGGAGQDLLIGGDHEGFGTYWGDAGQDIVIGGNLAELISGDFLGFQFFDFEFRGSNFRYFEPDPLDPGAAFPQVGPIGVFSSPHSWDVTDTEAIGFDGYLQALEYVLGIDSSTDLSSHYNDYLSGGDGNDFLYGGRGADVLLGGEGDDVLDADALSLQFAFNVRDATWVDAISGLFGLPGDDFLDGGDGNDRLTDADGGSDVFFGGRGNDTILSMDPHSESLSFTNYLDGGEGNDTLIASNPSLFGFDVLNGGPGDDVLRVEFGSAFADGGSGSDIYVVRDWSGRFPLDSLPTSLVINDFDSIGDAIDRLQISLVSPVSALSFSRDESNLYVGRGSDSSWITVENWFVGPEYRVEEIHFDNATTPGIDQIFDIAAIESQFTTTTASADVLWGSRGDDRLFGGEGDDTLSGNAGDDMLAGGEGNDILDGGEGADVYVFNIGDGVDRIFDNGSWGTDGVLFGPGITPEMLTLSLGSLRINVGQDGDAIHLDNVDPDDAVNSGIIEYFQFADGTNLTYQQLLDRGFDLTGTSGDDRLTGTSVNDRLRGLGGNDTYFFGFGSGSDFIEDNAGDSDVIVIGEGVLPDSVLVSRSGAMLSLTSELSLDRLTVHQDASIGIQIERVEFADGTVWDAARLEAMAAGHDNNAPVLSNPLADQRVQKDTRIKFRVPDDTFNEIDEGDTLDYNATLANGEALPAWLAFNPTSRTFSGTPAATDVGKSTIRVTATDHAGASAMDELQLTVSDGERRQKKSTDRTDHDDHGGHDHGKHDDEHHQKAAGRKHVARDEDRTDRKEARFANRLSAYLERAPRYDFEALSQEFERTEWNAAVADIQEIARRWHAADRYASTSAKEHDDDKQGMAVNLFIENGLPGVHSFDRGSGTSGSIGAMRRTGVFHTLQGLEEGLLRLHG